MEATASWNSPGKQTVEFNIGDTCVDADIWVVKLNLKTVKFTGTMADIKMDPSPNGAMPNFTARDIYPTERSIPGGAHWSTTAVAPIQHKINELLHATITFDLLPTDCPSTVTFTIKSDSALYPFDPGTGTISGTTVTANLTSSVELVDDVGHDPAIAETWQYSVSCDYFADSDESTHEIYRTLRTPGVRVHTIVHNACHGASGNTENAVRSSLWTANFSGRACSTFDSQPMKYWGTAPLPEGSPESLIAWRNGRCGEWQPFFREVLNVHTIPSTAASVDAPVPPSPAPAGYTFHQVLVVNPDLPGQNMSPPSAYAFGGAMRTTGPYLGHALVKYGEEVYDPSYGTHYDAKADFAGNLNDWESASVLGFLQYRSLPPVTGGVIWLPLDSTLQVLHSP